MKVFVTGATGLVGRALALRLAGMGHEVLAWVRSPQAARALLGPDVTLVPVRDDDGELCEALSQADAVINLAGAPVAKRWTDAYRKTLVRSRVDLTRRLVEAMASQSDRPRVLLSASAVGYYGDRGAEELPESAAPGEGFLPSLCVDWEAAASEAESLGLRVAQFRLGIVLDAEGGALAAMRRPFALGLGAVIGSGDQYSPFIHLRDLVELLVTALDDERYRGPINAVAPQTVTHREFCRELGRALHRPVWLRAPGFAVRAAMGDAASILLEGQRVVPQRAVELGFTFRFPTLAAALADVIEGGRSSVAVGPAADVPDHEYLARRKPRYLLEQRMTIDAPIDEVFAFFRQAENLATITPPTLAFEIRTPTPIDMQQGREITYRIRLGPVPMKWLTSIERWAPPQRFVDVQLQGPYRAWYHEHAFEPDGDRTTMVDRVWYAPPLGPLGWVAQRLMVGPMLRRIFGYRRAAIDLRFGVV